MSEGVHAKLAYRFCFYLTPDLESVDPSSLDVSSASVPAWGIAARTAQDTLDKVGEIDGKVERAEGARNPRPVRAESHENAAKSSADAAACGACL